MGGQDISDAQRVAGILPTANGAKPGPFSPANSANETPSAARAGTAGAMPDGSAPVNSLKLTVPGSQAAVSGNTTDANTSKDAPPRAPRFSFENPFQAGAVPGSAPTLAQAGAMLGQPHASAVPSDPSGAPRESADMLRDTQAGSAPLEINATATSPLSSIIASSPFELHTTRSPKDAAVGGSSTNGTDGIAGAEQPALNIWPAFGGMLFSQPGGAKSVRFSTNLDNQKHANPPANPAVITGGSVSSTNPSNPFAILGSYPRSSGADAAAVHKPFAWQPVSTITNPFDMNNSALPNPPASNGAAPMAPFSLAGTSAALPPAGSGLSNPFASAAGLYNPFTNSNPPGANPF